MSNNGYMTTDENWRCPNEIRSPGCAELFISLVFFEMLPLKLCCGLMNPISRYSWENPKLHVFGISKHKRPSGLPRTFGAGASWSWEPQSKHRLLLGSYRRSLGKG